MKDYSNEIAAEALDQEEQIHYSNSPALLSSSQKPQNSGQAESAQPEQQQSLEVKAGEWLFENLQVRNWKVCISWLILLGEQRHRAI